MAKYGTKKHRIALLESQLNATRATLDGICNKYLDMERERDQAHNKFLTAESQLLDANSLLDKVREQRDKERHNADMYFTRLVEIATFCEDRETREELMASERTILEAISDMCDIRPK